MKLISVPLSRFEPVLFEEGDREEWNQFTAWVEGADLLQSWEWGELKARSGWKPFRLAILEEGHITAAVSLLKRSLPLPGKSIFYAPRGPLLRQWTEERWDALLQAMKEIAYQERAILIKVDPALEKPEVAQLLRRKGFVFAGSPHGFGGIQPRCVMRLDLSPSPEELMASFKPKWRYNIRLAQRKGVTIKTECHKEDLPTFYRLLMETAERDGFTIRGYRYFEDLWDILVSKRMARLFLAEYQGQAIAGAICFYYGDTCWYTYGASSNQHREKMPNHLLQWTMILWARDHGYHTYDFRGVSPRQLPPEKDPLAGLNRFKEGFGAKLVEYIGEYDLPLSRILYPLWVKGVPLFRKILKKRRKPLQPTSSSEAFE